MTQDEINKMFENRWRVFGNYGKLNQNVATMSFDEFFEYIKGMCRDFFTAGILIAESSCPTGEPSDNIEVVCHDFDYWWKLYGKAVGRKDCEKKWAKMTVKEREDCIAATPAYVASTPDKQFRKNPLSYINQKAWNDEIIPRNNGTNKPSLDEQRRDKLASILVG